jgi:hypothetical protein
MVTRVRATSAGVLLLLLLVLASACSPKQMALNRMASAMASASSVYEADNDPEFVRLAAPGTLKTIEMLLNQSPDQPQLLLTACSGFAEYAYGFLHVEAEVKASDAAAAADLRARAGRMYQRARGYCLHALEVKYPGLTTQALASDPVAALKPTKVEDVPLLYWAAASWGAELSLASNQLARITELATARALLNRAKAMNDTFDQGAIYEAMIAFDGLSPLLGGSPERAHADFEKAIQLSEGKSVFAYVALAATTRDPAEKRRLLEQALAIDVSTLTSRRLMNLIGQRYARALLAAAR